MNQVRHGIELNKTIPQIPTCLRVLRHVQDRVLAYRSHPLSTLTLHVGVQQLAELLHAEAVRDVANHHRRARLLAAAQLLLLLCPCGKHGKD